MSELLHAFSEGSLATSTAVLEALVSDEDELARGISPAMPQPQGLGTPRDNEQLPADDPVSTTITAPGPWSPRAVGTSPPHPCTATCVTRLPPDLYDRDGYVIWSGGYSDFDREQGAEDLRRWRETTTSFPWLDVVYAHSHGGNVALDALARGQQVKLLVLLDTPANRRTDDEWVAIRSNVGGVIAMRTRLDLVVTADSLRNFEGPDQVRWTEASPFPGDWPLGHERGMVLALLLRDARKLGTIRPR